MLVINKVFMQEVSQSAVVRSIQSDTPIPHNLGQSLVASSPKCFRSASLPSFPRADLGASQGEAVPVSISKRQLNLEDFIEFNKSPTRLETLTLALDGLDRNDWRTFSKNFAYLLTGSQRLLHGLGLRVKNFAGLGQDQKRELQANLENSSQEDMDWKSKLSIGVLLGKLKVQQSKGAELPDGYLDRTDSKRSDVIEFLKRTAQAGDVVFFTTGGNREKFKAEMTELLTRTKVSNVDDTATFPFVHVGIVTSDGSVAHMTSKGLLIDSWDKLISKWRPYETIGLGRLSTSEREGIALAQEAFLYSQDKKYNSSWPIRDYIKNVILKLDARDDSATKKAIVCVDVITEAANILAKKGIVIDPKLEAAKNALDLFNLRSLKILAAFQIDLQSE